MMFWKGLILGFSIAAPVGPIGLLCIRKTLADGKFAGFVSGLGAATADALYACIAALGLTVISSFLLRFQVALKFIGAAFLVYLGIRTFLSRPATRAVNVNSKRSLWGTYGITFLLTLTNPSTILSFLAVFAGFGIGGTAGARGAWLIVVGAFAGSAAWWLLLTTIVGTFRHKFTQKGMVIVNRVSGLVIAGLGIFLALG